MVDADVVSTASSSVDLVGRYRRKGRDDIQHEFVVLLRHLRSGLVIAKEAVGPS